VGAGLVAARLLVPRPARRILIPVLHRHVQSSPTRGGAAGTTDDHAAGVQYDLSNSQWGIAHQDFAAMPAGAGFNVLLATPGAPAFILAGFTGSDSAVMIDNPLTNNNPNAFVFITPTSTPSGSAGAYNPHPAGVFYDTDAGRWWVFNQDGLAIPAQAAFNILSTSERRDLSLNAVAWNAFEGDRPEMLIPLPTNGRIAPEVTAFRPGQTARILSAPFAGQVGTLMDVLPGMSRLERISAGPDGRASIR
jgi:hypothetical protein